MQGQRSIVIPIHALEPGGVERVAISLAREWRRAGHKVVIVLGRTGKRDLLDVSDLACWQIPMPLASVHWETPWMIVCLARYLAEHKVDLVFYPGNTYAIVAAAMRLLRGRKRPPALLKVSNALVRPDMNGLLRRGYQAWLRLHAALFDRMVGLAEPMRQEIELATGADPSRLAIIPDGVLTRERLAQLSAIARPPSTAPAPGLRYCSAGRLVSQKNFPLLLRAFARAARPTDSLTIAGDGPERKALERLARGLGIADQVRFPGHVSPVDDVLRDSDIFVLSSDYEGVPAVVIEAMAAGLPVVTTDCCVSMPWLVTEGRSGLLVPVGDEAALADALIRSRGLSLDPAVARARAAAFSLEEAAARYIALIDEICATRDRAAGMSPAAHQPPSSRRWERAAAEPAPARSKR